MKNYINSFISYTVDLIIAVALSFSFVYAFISTLDINYRATDVLMLVCIVSVIYLISFANRLAIKISVNLLVLTVAGSIFYFLIKPQVFRAFYSKIVLVFIWLKEYRHGEVLLGMEYQKSILIALTIIISLVVYIFAIKKFNFYILLIGGVSIFVAQWIVGYFIIYFSFYIFLLFILICYFKHIYLRNTLENKSDSHVAAAKFLLLSAPICAIVLIVAYYMPSSDKPIEWSWMNSKIESMDYYIKTDLRRGDLEYFSISSTGFGSDNSRLGGNVFLDNTIVMKVDSSEGGIYLKGAVREVYTGDSWKNVEAEPTALKQRSQLNNFNEDLFELSNGSRFISNGTNVLSDVFNKTSIEITYYNLKTKTLFIPSKVYNLTFEEESLNVFIDSYGMISSEDFLNKQFKYTAELYNTNKNNKSMESLLRSSSRGIYSRYMEGDFRSSTKPQRNTPLMSDAMRLSQMSNNVYTKYLQLPDELPERVGKLALEITSSSNNDYDRAKAIEAYLSKNYRYTLEPGNIPQNHDFVDYFLFDSKQGYCTYYASAMTVLLRSIGIPARYVEGYTLPSKPISGTIYEVTNKEAHAWVEVYFEGFGWIPFEPTSSFSQGFNEVPKQTSNIEDTVSEQPDSEQNNQVSDSATNKDIASVESSVSNLDNDVKAQSLSFIKFAILIFIALLLWILFFSPVRRRILLYRVQRLPSQQGVIKMYKHFLRAFSVQGLEIKSGETPLKYAQRIDEVLGFKQFNFRTITDIFNKASYSDMPIDKEEIQLVITFYSTFPAKIKERTGWLRYFVCNNILGII